MGSAPAPAFGQSKTKSSLGYDPYSNYGRARAFDFLENPATVPVGFGTQGIGQKEYGFNPDLGQLNGIVGALSSLGNMPTPTQAEALDIARQASDMGNIQNAYKNYFGQIVTPNIRNSLGLAGGNRSGAEAEAVSMAGNQAAVPLTTLQNQRMMERANLTGQIGTSAADRELRGLLGGGQLSLGGQDLLTRAALGGQQLDLAQGDQGIRLLQTLFSMLQPMQTSGGSTTRDIGVGGRFGGQVSVGAGVI